jgi:catechol 2,3-dioxygenase-like lactoylglutathione lyase family enzyme
VSIEGISHITFIATDLERTANLLCTGLGATQVYDSAGKNFSVSLRALGVEIQPSRPRVEGEGQSLYFYDFDNNLFELHTGTLEQRLERYKR